MSENENKELQPEENPVVEKENIVSSNIFDDFNADSSLVEEVKKLKEEETKDVYYYLSLAGKIFQTLFIIVLLVFIVLFAYIHVQKDDSFGNSRVLDLVCSLVNNSEVEIPKGNTYCSSASYTKVYYENEIKTLKSKQVGLITTNLVAIYEKDNILKSKGVVFLEDKSKNRLQIIDVLNEFESLKYEFTGQIKQKIQCRNMNIDSVNKILSLSCDAYSQGYESEIVGFSGQVGDKEKVSGTSISVANSFLTYIEKNGNKKSDSKKSMSFTLVDRQKMFTVDKVSVDSEFGKIANYTDKTTFTVKLKINF